MFIPTCLRIIMPRMSQQNKPKGDLNKEEESKDQKRISWVVKLNLQLELDMEEKKKIRKTDKRFDESSRLYGTI